jgi:hypothetical protein
MSFPMCMLSWKSKKPVGCCSMKLITISSARWASSGLVDAAIEDVDVDGVTSRFGSFISTRVGMGGGRMVSAGVTVRGRSSMAGARTAWSRLCSGSDGSPIGESRGSGFVPSTSGPDPNASTCGYV